MDVFLRLSGVLLIAGGGLSQFYQSQLYCHRLMPPALIASGIGHHEKVNILLRDAVASSKRFVSQTSIVTPCRFPCMLKYDEYSDSIMIRYDPDGTLCGNGVLTLWLSIRGVNSHQLRPGHAHTRPVGPSHPCSQATPPPTFLGRVVKKAWFGGFLQTHPM
ncbi:uncharacterized protein LOC142786711 isoform X3 [Rhipicephalus microplus]|uniref:uncharacterized protein LOC142786711 isoform X3 n=1 Tax=Rhipicephalus microplus TaxID=6941 RepID=UPI003F6AB7FD